MTRGVTSAQSGRSAREPPAGSGATLLVALPEQPRPRPLDVDQGLLAQAADLVRGVRREPWRHVRVVEVLEQPVEHGGERPVVEGCLGHAGHAGQVLAAAGCGEEARDRVAEGGNAAGRAGAGGAMASLAVERVVEPGPAR